MWTPWQTLLIAEETVNSALKDPTLPAARGGHVYEVDPVTGTAVLRAAVGSRSHEGLRFDPQGNLYGISEASPPTGGYIYKFVPTRKGDLSQGKLYALKVTVPTGDRTSEAVWQPLNAAAAALDSDAEATRIGATGYGRPEDIEIFTSTGNQPGGWTLFVAATSEHRVLGIDLREPAAADEHATAFVYDYVQRGLNASADFSSPDNLALDKSGNLYITEDPSTPPARTSGPRLQARLRTSRLKARFVSPVSRTALRSRVGSTSTRAAGHSTCTCNTPARRTRAT